MNQKEFIEYINDRTGGQYIGLGTNLTCTNGIFVYKVLPICNDTYSREHIFERKVNIQDFVYQLDYAPCLYEYFYEESCDIFVIKTQYLKNFIPVSEYIREYVFSLTDMNNLITEITKVINVLIDNYIDHGDPNTENILINPKTKQIKLIDFELSYQDNELYYDEIISDLVDTINELYLIYNNKLSFYSPTSLEKLLNYFYERERKRGTVLQGDNQRILDNIGHLIEECIELKQCFPRKYWKENEKIAPIEEQLSELADVFIMWCIQAYSMNVKPYQVVTALQEKIQYNNKRIDHEKITN